MGGAYVGDFSSITTYSFLYAGSPVPAGIRRPMMTFSLLPRRGCPPPSVLGLRPARGRPLPKLCSPPGGYAQQGGVVAARFLKGNARSSLRSRVDDGDSHGARAFDFSLQRAGTVLCIHRHDQP